MKKEFSYIMCLFFMLAFLPACNAQESYRIDGRAEGFADGSKVSLVVAATHNNDEKPDAEITIQNGVFSFSDQMDEPKLYTLIITEPSGCKGAQVFMLDNSSIKINVRKGNVRSADYMEFAEFEVEGSSLDKEFRERMRFRDELNDQYNAMHEKYKDINAKIDAAYDREDNAEVQKLKSTDVYKEFMDAEGQFFRNVEEAMFAAFRRNSDSFWGPLLMLHNVSYFTSTDPNFSKYVEIYESLPAEAKNSFYGKILGEELTVKTLVGKQVPEFSLPDKDGKNWQNTALLQGKKLLLIDFWASWCGPCRKSIPTLKEIYKEFSGKGLEIVSISTDKKEDDWRKALEEEQFPWPSLWDTQNVFPEKFNGKAIPMFILVDENGVVLDDTVMIQNLRQKIESVL